MIVYLNSQTEQSIPEGVGVCHCLLQCHVGGHGGALGLSDGATSIIYQRHSHNRVQYYYIIVRLTQDIRPTQG